MNNLTNIGAIKALMARHGFHFSKAMGQNFIVNPSVCPRIAEMGGAAAETGALEIGPGIGVLTAELAKRCRKVVCVELDKRLPAILAETLADFDNVSIVTGDIMDIDLEALLAEHFPDMDVIVCANLPYYITSPVIMKLLESRLRARSVTVMVQKEAARRLCAPLPSRESGAVTLAVRYYAEPRILFDVSRGSFMPAPDVDSSVIRLDIRESPAVAVDDEALFFQLIKAAFAQRRKTLLNSLSGGFGMEKALVADILVRSGVNPGVRAENLTLDDFARIEACWKS
ncbi:MAG: 16S rRNA (adenine(1518)-N(6)/adenine(1519)-N(6))-dimethyltransferase RsmA [Oscillospiraceae bacterium]|jgi:16S rRNA (adenine1518-N6/adenine1519-N6)-dimethyltransferase|nr:16S rRNA (adenine(1518)-N(6)/adenine(1519)-N(6))-dimethyltransferase RsmA [Oscillospiraceae bacterium]